MRIIINSNFLKKYVSIDSIANSSALFQNVQKLFFWHVNRFLQRPEGAYPKKLNNFFRYL